MYLQNMKLLVKHINPTRGSHNASVIFLHGSGKLFLKPFYKYLYMCARYIHMNAFMFTGDTGKNLIEWIRFLLGREMEFPHIKVIYPTAPFKPYTPLGGQMSNVWFDRESISMTVPENLQSLEEIYKKLNEMINEEILQGVPVNRIIVGGFSMGGALAIHTGYHLNTKLCGVFACSSFLNQESVVYESLKRTLQTDTDLPELRMFHGGRDTLVPLEWGQKTFENLLKLGVKGEFTPLKNTLHELKRQELLDLEKWILHKLPPQDK